jgi:hypothetical protein
MVKRRGMFAVGTSRAIKSLPMVVAVAAGTTIDTAAGGVSGALAGLGRIPKVVLAGDASKSPSEMTFTLVHLRYSPLVLMGLIMSGVSSVIMPGIHVSAATLIRVAPTTHPRWVQAAA